MAAVPLTYKNMAGMVWASDSVTYSQSSRVVDEMIDGVDANPVAPNFTYDNAGRLTGSSRSIDRSPGYRSTVTHDPHTAGEFMIRTLSPLCSPC